MRILSAVALCLGFLSILAGQEKPPELPQPDASAVFKTTPQGELRLHIFRPAGWKASDKRPAIVFFFGGGWVNGSPSQFYPHARHLAGKGMVAISAEYRIRSKHGTSPAECIADGKSAIRWVRNHAGELGVDPSRIGAGGGSAGGHVAAATATAEGFDEPGEKGSGRPAALVLFNPALDTVTLKLAAERFGSHAQAGSPVHNVRKGVPPAIVFHGTADTTVPFSQAEEFCKKVLAVKGKCEVVPYEGKSHGFFNYTRDREAFQDTLTHVDRFMQDLGWYLRL